MTHMDRYCFPTSCNLRQRLTFLYGRFLQCSWLGAGLAGRFRISYFMQKILNTVVSVHRWICRELSWRKEATILQFVIDACSQWRMKVVLENILAEMCWWACSRVDRLGDMPVDRSRISCPAIYVPSSDDVALQRLLPPRAIWWPLSVVVANEFSGARPHQALPWSLTRSDPRMNPRPWLVMRTVMTDEAWIRSQPDRCSWFGGKWIELDAATNLMRLCRLKQGWVGDPMPILNRWPAHLEYLRVDPWWWDREGGQDHSALETWHAVPNRASRAHHRIPDWSSSRVSRCIICASGWFSCMVVPKPIV